MFSIRGMGTSSLQVPKHPFRWKLGGGSRNPQPAPQEVQQSREEPGMPVNTIKLAEESGYHNPDPLVCLLGCANETKVVIEGVEMMALVNTGTKCLPSLRDSV